MGNLEHIERRLSLPVASHLSVDERLERIKAAYVDVLDRTDPESATKLRRYSKTDLVCFIQDVVDHDNRRVN